MDVETTSGICYKQSQLHQAIAATNCSIFAMCLHKIIVSFCYLNNVMLQACVLGKLLLATKPTKTVVMGKQAPEGFLHHHPPFVSTNIFSTHCFFLASPHRRASFACKAQRNVVEDPGCCKISHKDCATAFRCQEHILTAQSGATWSSWWCWWCRKAYTSWCDLKTIKMNYTDLTIPQVMQECALFFQISLRHCLNFILSIASWTKLPLQLKWCQNASLGLWLNEKLISQSLCPFICAISKFATKSAWLCLYSMIAHLTWRLLKTSLEFF